MYLLYLDRNGETLNDTYHASRDAAEAQAAYEFEVHDRDWDLGTTTTDDS